MIFNVGVRLGMHGTHGAHTCWLPLGQGSAMAIMQLADQRLRAIRVGRLRSWAGCSLMSEACYWAVERRRSDARPRLPGQNGPVTARTGAQRPGQRLVQPSGSRR